MKLIGGLYLFLTKIALAQEPAPGGSGAIFTGPGERLPDPLKAGSITCLLDRLATQLIYIASPIVAIMVIIGGFQMLFAAGNPEKFKEGQKTILYAAVGFAVVLIAKGVTSIISGVLGVDSAGVNCP